MINFCKEEECKECKKDNCICIYCTADCETRFFSEDDSCQEYKDWLSKITKRKKSRAETKWWVD